MKVLISFAFLLALSFSGFAQTEDHSKDEKAAVKAAEQWLEIVDEGKYADSWDGTAKFFQGNMTKEAWDAALQGVLPPLGKMKSRELVSSRFLKRMPSAPDGEYVMIQFKTSFENKADAVETVTPQKDEKGKWHVCGYFIN
ncbi:DUF4019 domain-containing protein [bacterium]|nr:DUF4019 domain-containing protein [bacterium]